MALLNLELALSDLWLALLQKMDLDLAPSNLGLTLLDLELSLSGLWLALLQKIDLDLAPSNLGLASLELWSAFSQK